MNKPVTYPHSYILNVLGIYCNTALILKEQIVILVHFYLRVK